MRYFGTERTSELWQLSAYRHFQPRKRRWWWALAPLVGASLLLFVGQSYGESLRERCEPYCQHQPVDVGAWTFSDGEISCTCHAGHVEQVGIPNRQLGDCHARCSRGTERRRDDCRGDYERARCVATTADQVAACNVGVRQARESCEQEATTWDRWCSDDCSARIPEFREVWPAPIQGPPNPWGASSEGSTR